MKFKDGNFYAVERISPRIEKSPEGYLVCRDVPISRVGTFEYLASEVGLQSSTGKVKVSRSAQELFRDETMRSFEGKPVTLGHSQFASPQNWKQVAVGTTHNVRRGEGEEYELLLADLQITDKHAIQLIEREGLREVSCGYDANPIADGDGIAHQEGIVGNHVALVQKARCGEVCSIRDGFDMETQKQGNLKTWLRRLFKDGDEDKFNEAIDQLEVKAVEDEDPKQPPVDDTKSPEERISVLEHEYQEMAQRLEEIKQMLEGKETTTDADPEDKTDEEVVESEEVDRVMADAETICPGMKKPVGDSKDGKFTKNHVERIMRQALKDGGIQTFGDSADLEGKALSIAFKAAAQMAKTSNNMKAIKRHTDSAPKSRLEQINEQNKKFWEGK